MARTVWKGALNFGLVNVPVGLYPATQDRAVHFHQLEEGTSDRIRYQKVNERTGEEVSPDRIVKAFDLGGGEYVEVSEDELDAVAAEKSRLIEITDFVDLDEIDPIYYRSTFYLAPEGEAADKAYSLLRQVMRQADKVAIGSVVMRNREYPVAIRAVDQVLTLETLYFADEIRTPDCELPHLPSATKLSDREVKMARLLLESMEGPWNPEDLQDTHRQGLEHLIEEKRQGNEIVTGVDSSPSPTKVVDLMEVLSASIDKVDGSRRSGASHRRTKPGTTTKPKGKATKASSKATKASSRATKRPSARKGAGVRSAKASKGRKAS